MAVSTVHEVVFEPAQLHLYRATAACDNAIPHRVGHLIVGEIVMDEALEDLEYLDLQTHGSLIFIRVLRIYNALYFLPLHHFHIFV